MADEYDEQIARLKADPDSIYEEWSDGIGLFRFCGAGCLTMIHSEPHLICAYTEDLTAEIAADGRIPNDPDEITLDDLPVFAEWQRRIDKEFAPLRNEYGD